MKTLTIVGARPQFVKAAPVSRALARRGIEERLVDTGQHYDWALAGAIQEQLLMRPPDYDLGIGSGTHAEQTGRMIMAIEPLILRHGPDAVLVYGDTNSTLAGALAAAKLHVPVAHVEAGLRSFNRKMAEEVNRIVADHLSEILFCPTAAAVRNLASEGITTGVFQTGDVMLDAVLYFRPSTDRDTTVLDRFGINSGGYILCTVHRAENTDDPGRLAAILEGMALLSARLPVLLPIHPRTAKAIELHGLRAMIDPAVRTGRLIMSEPVDYIGMLTLERHAAVIATDSGGVQKEAFFCRVPCVTLRDETEWTELLDLGWNRLCPPRSADLIRDTILAARGTAGAEGTPYGDGNAAGAIVDVLANRLA